MKVNWQTWLANMIEWERDVYEVTHTHPSVVVELQTNVFDVVVQAARDLAPGKYTVAQVLDSTSISQPAKLVRVLYVGVGITIRDVA